MAHSKARLEGIADYRLWTSGITRRIGKRHSVRSDRN